MEELRREPCVTASDIGVAVHDGTVTLSGTVPTFAEKRAAEQATRRVAGVKAVAEEIKVKPTGRHQRSDTAIAEMVARALEAHVWVPTDVTATVENGWVSLRGVVNWEFQIDAATEAIRYLAGVRGITNGILIHPTARPAEVRQLIEEDLARNAELDAQSIRVEAEGGTVTLSGTVRSSFERDEAARVAYRAPGVILVENHITVSGVQP
jgi:osmotically-inducible protein OsmY